MCCLNSDIVSFSVGKEVNEPHHDRVINFRYLQSINKAIELIEPLNNLHIIRTNQFPVDIIIFLDLFPHTYKLILHQIVDKLQLLITLYFIIFIPS